jgi:hypothetical protein
MQTLETLHIGKMVPEMMKNDRSHPAGTAVVYAAS